jgi:3-phenylpropionate/cinnamic acid dioxygenase small subunit
MSALAKPATASDDLRDLPEQELHYRVAQFLYHEAYLQDTHAYDEWEALWEEDAIYWIPANGHNTDPEQQMSIIYDNRSRIRVRVEQLKTGRRHTQTPRSELARTISNIRIGRVSQDEVQVHANMMIFEDNLRGETSWAARNEYTLRLREREFRLARKKVGLVNNGKPIFTLSFLV